MRKRPIRVAVRLNEQEHRHLKEQVELSGFSTEKYLRGLIAGSKIKQRPPGELPALLRQLSAIGNNINQIAKIANTYKCVREEDIERITSMQSEIWRSIKRI